MGKANAVVSEEASVREVFKQKLGRHFLKQLFPGMFDSFPNFVLANLPTFDKDLPPVSPEDLRTLRQVVHFVALLSKISKHVQKKLSQCENLCIIIYQVFSSTFCSKKRLIILNNVCVHTFVACSNVKYCITSFTIYTSDRIRSCRLVKLLKNGKSIATAH